jgi:RHS repeat-associated protein
MQEEARVDEMPAYQSYGQTSNGTTLRYLVDDDNPTSYGQVVEERTAGVETKYYIYGIQRTLLRDTGGKHYYIYDAHSGVRLLLNSVHEITDSWDYDAFGSVLARGGSTDNDFTYQAEFTEPISKLEYLRDRWLLRDSARFLTGDSFSGFADSPQTQHRFNYVAASPVDFIDPSGMCADPGGVGLRLCLDTFIPDAYVSVPVYIMSMGVMVFPYQYKGDDRGPSSDSDFGTSGFRTQHWVWNFATSNASSQFLAGITHRITDVVAPLWNGQTG